MMYLKGEGMKQDLLKSRELYQQGADLDDEESQFLLGQMYNIVDGGISRDFEKTVYWLKRSAAKGYQLAINELLKLKIKKPTKEEL